MILRSLLFVPVIPRVNSLDTEWLEADLAAASWLAMPKTAISSSTARLVVRWMI